MLTSKRVFSCGLSIYLLAVTSFLPIFFYALFILLFSLAELIIILPTRYRTISKLLLPIIIFLIGTFNQLASLVGISHGPQLILMTLVVMFNS
jgi:hypothetical protein